MAGVEGQGEALSSFLSLPRAAHGAPGGLGLLSSAQSWKGRRAGLSTGQRSPRGCCSQLALPQGWQGPGQELAEGWGRAAGEAVRAQGDRVQLLY